MRGTRPIHGFAYITDTGDVDSFTHVEFDPLTHRALEWISNHLSDIVKLESGATMPIEIDGRKFFLMVTYDEKTSCPIG